jgi:raffinose/stachyose/melibiose transport system substrate-binding protein
MLKAIGASALLAGVPYLAACSSTAGGRTGIRFEMTKFEVIPHFQKLVADYNKSQSRVRATLDTQFNATAGFVRGAPPDVDCDNFNLTAATYVSRGVLADLAELPAAQTVNPQMQFLVEEYALYKGETSVLPFSVTAAGVFYNMDVFEQAGVDVPQTWSELLALCRTLESKRITPFFGTFAELWTTTQGLFDYVAGGVLDVASFYKQLNAQGSRIGADSAVSFEKDFAPACAKMLELLPYFQPGAANQTFSQGNTAFANGAAAMYMQGPWAVSSIKAVNPKIRLGCFPLPATDNAADTKCRVNLDLAIWIPRALQGSKREAANELVAYLMQPDIVTAYNEANLAFSPQKHAPALSATELAGLQPNVAAGRFYQGPSQFIPNAIPVQNYVQQFVADKNSGALLRKLDADYKRLATRTSG